MRTLISIAAVACLALGVAWRFGGWIVEWIGRLLGLRGVVSDYETFVEHSVGIFMAEGSIARILGPWLLIGIGLVLLAVLYVRTGEDPVRR